MNNEVLFLKKVRKIILWCFFFMLTFFLAVYAYAFFDRLSLEEERKNITIYDNDSSVIYESNFKKNLSWTPIDEIPDFLQDAFVAVEDKRFYYHPGFDPIRISKALITNLAHGEIVQGGSTITQQYAKNLFLTNEQTFSRKIEELLYAARLEMQYSKKDILEGYLNTIYFGHGIYGVASASEFFFGKDMKDLSIAQTAMLVGIPNGPSLYSPYVNEEHAKKRQDLILSVLEHNHLITTKQMQEAQAEELAYVDHSNDEDPSINQYYINAVLEELNKMDISLDQEIQIHTYYQEDVQRSLNNAIRKNMPKDSELETAAIITQPFSGGVMALSGGKDYTLSQYNRAIHSSRQVASTIKPLLYYDALQQGFTPSTQFLSQKTTFQLPNQEPYSPSNYGNLYANANISMINALSLSDNIYAVKTHLFLGEETLHNSLLKFGITQSQPTPSEALGTVSMNLMELSRIYMALASEGLYVQPSLIRSINTNEEVLYEHEKDIKPLLDRDDCLIISQMLTSTYDIKNKGYTFPSMYGYEPNIKMAIKSGTSDWDSLVMAYNPEYIFSIWCGFDDNRILEKKYYSSSKEIFKDTMNALYEKKEGPWYQPSNNIIEKKVDPVSGFPSSNGSVYWYRNK